MRVLYHYDAGPALRRRLASLDAEGLRIEVCGEQDDAGFLSRLPGTEVLWHCLRPLDAATLAAAPALRLIQKIGVGVNTIDLAAARARGIAVCNMPGTNSAAVAEHALGLMLAVLRRITTFDALTRAGQGWSRAPSLEDRLGELGGRTVGLVGYGAGARALAPALTALGARLLYTARSPKADALGAFRELDALLAEADVVSLHLPLTDETRGLIDRERLSRMRPGAVLINTARGGLVDEPALLDALASGRLAGAGLDVFAEEPVDPAHPLLARDDVVLTPHVAWLTQETLERSLDVAVENCRRLAAGAPLLHRVI
jgi:phosphoglycerate dehydrogenase-like enzyme